MKKVVYEILDLPDHISAGNEGMLQQGQSYYDRMKRRHSVWDFKTVPVPAVVIQECIRRAGTAPSGANHQPWHFVAIFDLDFKHQIRLVAELEEKKFYEGGGGDERIKALEPLGTNADKPYLTVASWLIVGFAQRWGAFDGGSRYKNYYGLKSVGMAMGFLISALHHADLMALTHTANPMKFLNDMLDRPSSKKPVMIIAAGRADPGAQVPKAAKIKNHLNKTITIF